MEEDTKKEESQQPAAAAGSDGDAAELARQRDEYLAGWQRARADFANYKREEYARMEEAVRYANKEFLRELLAVLDSFDLGLAAMEKSGTVDRGVYMIRAQLEDTLRRFGLQRLAIERGSPYDPAVAEAVAEVESDLPEHSVVEEIAAGYKLADQVLRPARVTVAKAKKQTE